MPQPLSLVAPTANITITTGALQARSELAVLAMQVVAIGSHAEFDAGSLLAFALGTNLRAGIAMFQAVSSDDGKRNMIKAVAAVQLGKEDAELVEAVFAVTKGARSTRNVLAHHIWALADTVPDGLLLINPRDLQNTLAEAGESRERYEKMLVEWRDADRPGGAAAPQGSVIDPALVSVWRKNDFERAVLEASEAASMFARLREIAEDPTSGKALQAQAKLRSWPRIERWLQRQSSQSS